MVVPIVNAQEGYCHRILLEDLNSLQNTYPELEILNIGKSVLGRNIPAVRLGKGPRKIHYNGSFHANEWITSLLLMMFIEQYCFALSENKPFYGHDITLINETISLWIVPMVNPDGVDLVQNGLDVDKPYYDKVLRANKGSTNFKSWKANIRGVDLNDQFPANWERELQRRVVNMPAPLNYPGPSSLSEPEAKAMADFTEKIGFDLVMAFHAQGEEIYWGYEQMEPYESKVIVRKLEQVSGYKPIQYVESDAGYKDWFIKHWRRPGFTIECGRGQNPLPIHQYRSVWQKVLPIMLTGLIV